MINKLKLSENVCIPCISKSQDVKCINLTQTEFNKLINENKKVYVFDGTKATTDGDKAYIKYGEEMEYNKSYLTSHRKPWYSIENKDIPSIFISVFSRNKLKIIRNEAGVNSLTTFHSLFINDKSDENLYFCYLITPIAQKILLNNKREYGKGLNKFEPNDLNESFVLNMDVISENDKEFILSMYEDLNKIKINILNNLFLKYIKKN